MPPATNGNLCFSLSLTFSILFLLIFGGLCTVNPHAIIPRILMCISVLFCYTISSVNYDDQPIEQDDRTRQHPNAVGLGKSAIEAIPTFVYDISTGTQCTICLSAMKSGELVKKLPICKHEFHVECIDTLLGSHSTCPNCRSEVQAPEDASVVEISQQQPAVLLPRQPSSANRSASMSSMSSALTCGCDWLCTRGFQVFGAGNWRRKRPIWSSHQHQYCCQCSL